jgi:hypothetical protein
MPSENAATRRQFHRLRARTVTHARMPVVCQYCDLHQRNAESGPRQDRLRTCQSHDTTLGFGTRLWRIRAIHRSQFRQIVDILSLRFEGILRLAVLCGRRRRIEMQDHRVKEAASKGGKEHDNPECDSAKFQKISHGSPIPP